MEVTFTLPTSGHTADNKRFSEMAVGVEIEAKNVL